MNKLVLKSVSIEIEAISAGHPPVCVGEPQKATIQYAGETYEFDVIFYHVGSVAPWPKDNPQLHRVEMKAEGYGKLEVES